MKWSEQTREDLWALRPVGLSFAILAFCAGVAFALDFRLLSAGSLETGLMVGVIFGPVVGPMVASWKKPEAPVQATEQALYLEGKMKRYSLLFSVNGGAFAVAKLLKEPKPPGGLGIAGLSVGAIVFTVIMTADIWLWGAGMRNEHGAKLFRPVGQTILLMLGALLCSGWLLVGRMGG